ncbi:hypothetical protein E3U23_09400 [Erythrobacter litoralis]|uniref:hypothetical protein n=1 Tax=Erythrobacter litoralis TaxID=39960 RepID=UPI00243559C8|nr:hypothetical protein [Erythrobacter litoralis]MDG6079406.1 hypothetical protein [Erythrobacter litoralis]
MKRASPTKWWLPFVVLMVVAAILAIRYLSPLRNAEGFHIPSAAEAFEAQGRFAAVLQGDATSPPSGLIYEDDNGVTLLSEPDNDCLGRGSYALRRDASNQIAILAPHRGSDLFTGTITARLFDEQAATAAAWNSAPRHGGANCVGGDPTRHETHYLTAFSLAFAERYPAGRIVQLHGFDRDKRASRAAQLADIIVSDGTIAPNAGLLDLADCLSRELHPLRVAVYPGDVAELGALSNRQGQALHAVGFSGFAHIEMARSVRQSLANDRAIRARFARCLTAGLS